MYTIFTIWVTSIQPQYEFVYTALLEFIICGDTSIAGAEALKQKVTKLSAIDNLVNKAGFQLQFEVISLYNITITFLY